MMERAMGVSACVIAAMLPGSCCLHFTSRMHDVRRGFPKELIMSHAFIRALLAGGLVLAGSFVLAGCASSGGTPAVNQENAVVHIVSAEDEAATHSKEPLTAQTAVLWVNGLGCPQCATNIDFQLKRLRGVQDVYTDLGSGKVTVSMGSGTKPSPYRLSEAVKDAGMTMVKIEGK
jgi:copper chaperone CopZ